MIKTAAQILNNRARPVDRDARYRSSHKQAGGRPPTHTHCTLPDCGEKHHGNGLCKRHGKILRLWGDPNHVYVHPGTKVSWCGCPVHQGRPRTEES